MNTNGINVKMVLAVLVGIIVGIIGIITIVNAPPGPKNGKKDPEWRRKTIERGRAHRNGIIMISVGAVAVILGVFVFRRRSTQNI